jgi:hypothetical protein
VILLEHCSLLSVTLVSNQYHLFWDVSPRAGRNPFGLTPDLQLWFTSLAPEIPTAPSAVSKRLCPVLPYWADVVPEMRGARRSFCVEPENSSANSGVSRKWNYYVIGPVIRLPLESFWNTESSLQTWYELRFPQQWLWRWPSSGLWRRVDWCEFTDVSEICTPACLYPSRSVGGRDTQFGSHCPGT